jgi:hypothetical protein
MMDSDSHDHSGCNCDMCHGGMTFDDLKAKEVEMTEKYGFFSHYVSDPNCKYVNYHTHGFRKTWEHDDLQIVIPLPPNIANNLFWTFADRVKAGERFAAGARVDKIVHGHQVILKKAKEGDRDVLRIILPDKNGRFPEDPGVDHYFGKQETADLIEPILFGGNVGENN